MQKSELTTLAYSIERGLIIALSLLASGFIGLFYFIVLRRITYPFPLEWTEGAGLDMIRRIVHHQQIYVEPSKDFVSFLYTPVYYYLGAALSYLTGLNIVTLRLLSVLATSGCFVLIFDMVRRQTRDWFTGWIACGLFAALYAHSNGWFDLGRVDMLYVFFLLLAINLAERGYLIWSAIVFIVAFQTKQSAATIAVFVLASQWNRPRRLIAALSTFGFGVFFTFWLLDRESHGWYRYYTVFLPAHHAWARRFLAEFWLHDLLSPLGVVFVFVLLALALFVSQITEIRTKAIFWAFTTIGITLSSLAARLHVGGAVNSTLPLYSWVCILFGLSMHVVLLRTKEAPAQLVPLLSIVALAACGIQFGQLVYLPGRFVPTTRQREEAEQVLKRVSMLPGKIFVNHQVIDAGGAGIQEFAVDWEVWDVLRGDQGEAGQRLKTELIHSFQNHEFAGILSDGPPDDMLPDEVKSLKDVKAAAAAAYPKQERILSPSEAKDFFSLYNIKPEFLYVPQ